VGYQGILSSPGPNYQPLTMPLISPNAIKILLELYLGRRRAIGTKAFTLAFAKR